jgi:hypothetical protein
MVQPHEILRPNLTVGMQNRKGHAGNCTGDARGMNADLSSNFTAG